MEKQVFLLEKRLREKVEQKTEWKSEAQQKRYLKSFFKKVDHNGDGTLDEKEFLLALRGLGFDTGSDIMSGLFRKYDTDHSRVLTYDEFINGLYDPVNVQGTESKESALAAVRDDILRKGGMHGVAHLKQKFELLDRDRDGCLSYDEAKEALRAFGVSVSEVELARAIQLFDVDRDGTLTIDEFIRGVKGPISSRRRDVVYQAFSIIDVDRRGEVTHRNLQDSFVPESHPRVRKGDWKVADAIKDFVKTWKRVGYKGKISKQAFLEHYENLSCHFDDDASFERMALGCWRSPEAYRSSSRSSSRAQSRSGSRPGTSRSHRSRGENYAPSPSNGGYTSRRSDRRDNRASSQHSHRPSSRHSHRSSSRSSRREQKTPDDYSDDDEGELDKLIFEEFRKKLLARGSGGIAGIARVFKIFDDNGDKKLTLDELKYGLKDYGMDIKDKDVGTLFHILDTDGGGSINLDEFLIAMKGDLNERRKNLVKKAYGVLDVTGDGKVDIEDMQQAYDVSKHPDVISGKLTEHQALVQFMSQWDNEGGKADGLVTFSEFLRYYKGVSSSIDDDDYFELMIRNAWHISGGDGVCENTSNLRVLVTFTDGTQKVIGLENDIGIDRGNMSQILRALTKQGVRNIKKVSVAG